MPKRRSEQHQETPLPQRRLNHMGLVILGWILLILGRLIWLQWVEHETYQARAQLQHESKSHLIAPRGAIVDRHGESLVTSKVLNSVYFDPKRFQFRLAKEKRTLAEKRQEAAQYLAPLLGQSPQQLLATLENRKSLTSLRRRIPPDEAKQVRQIIADHRLTGIEFEEEEVRAYPNHQLAAHLLGYVGWTEAPIQGTVSAPNLPSNSTEPAVRGVAGIESRFDNFLEGHKGEVAVVRDARRKPYQRTDLPPTAGSTVWLTIDATLQRKVELLLEQTVRRR